MKYRNVPIQIGAEKYRSKLEAARHQELLRLARAGMIHSLKREVPFVLAPGAKLFGENRARPAMRYIADFTYTETHSGVDVVEDAKGMQTPVYRMKKHLMATVLGVFVREVR